MRLTPCRAIADPSFTVLTDRQWYPFDGIVGLSYPGASVSGHAPLVDVLMSRRLLKENVFSLYLTHSKGESAEDDEAHGHAGGGTLILGGTDERFHLDEISFFPVEPPYVFWMLNVSRISLRESALSASSTLDRRTLVTLCEEGASSSSNQEGNENEESAESSGAAGDIKNAGGCKAVIDSGTSLISGPSGMRCAAMLTLRAY